MRTLVATFFQGSRKQAVRGWRQRWQTIEAARVARKAGDTEQISK